MPTNSFRPGTLGFRLLVGASIWLMVALAVTFFVLTGLFRDTVTRNFDIVLVDHVDELLSLIDVRADGATSLRRHPVDPRFVTPGSGWYWVISDDASWRESSASLGDNPFPSLTNGGHAADGGFRTYPALDYTGRNIRVISQRGRPSGGNRELTFLLSGPAVVIDAAVDRFNGALLLGLLALGLTLVFAVVIQVSFGLQPLRAVGRSLAAIRAGRSTRLEGDFPEELAPLANELNALLTHNQQSIQRTRERIDDLAHALKTPMAVLKNAAETIGGTEGDAIRTQVAAMGGSVEHHLSRARIAGTGDIIGARAAVKPLVEGLRRTVSQIYADRNVEIGIDIGDDLIFRGERQDLTEMLGNLMDNACKWASGRIHLSASVEKGILEVVVEDDGPGIPANEREAALDRGARLDGTTPGSGLGLAIVRDIAKLYGGNLELARSADGGVAARLRLPAAAP